MGQPVARSHCHACGSAYEGQEGWPRTCPSCGLQEWRRIDVVGVIVQPVTDNGRIGLLVGERGIEPRLGQHALPSGFAEFGEPVEDAARRELLEETGVTAPDEPLTFLFSRATPGGQLLVFFQAAALPLSAIDQQFAPSPECPRYRVLFEPEELAFPIHTEVAAKWLASRAG